MASIFKILCYMMCFIFQPYLPPATYIIQILPAPQTQVIAFPLYGSLYCCSQHTHTSVLWRSTQCHLPKSFLVMSSLWAFLMPLKCKRIFYLWLKLSFSAGIFSIPKLLLYPQPLTPVLLTPWKQNLEIWLFSASSSNPPAHKELSGLD